MPVKSFQKKRYIITFINDFSRFAITAGIRQKSDAPEAIRNFTALFKRATGAKVPQLRTDHSGAYCYTEFLGWLKKQEIMLKPTVAYHSKTNTVAERFNRTIVTMIRANLGKLPKATWELSLEYSTFIKNRIPHSAIQATPIERAIPSIHVTEQWKLFRPFGEQVYIHTYQDSKLQDRAQAARIVGFTSTYRIYKVILPNQQVVTAKDPLPRLMEEPAIIDMHKQTNNLATLTSPEEPAAIMPPMHTSPPRTPEREAKVIDTKWVLKEKREKDTDNPKRFKARLTARGFT